MIKHKVQKKRVIVMDCDVGLDEEKWKNIMRHVLGRHYADLQGSGPGWSFSINHLETFLEKVSKTTMENTVPEEETANQEQNVCSTQTEEKNVILLEQGQQTIQTEQNACSTQTENDIPNAYKYDIDDNVRFFVDKWIQQHNITLF